MGPPISDAEARKLVQAYRLGAYERGLPPLDVLCVLLVVRAAILGDCSVRARVPSEDELGLDVVDAVLACLDARPWLFDETGLRQHPTDRRAVVLRFSVWWEVFFLPAVHGAQGERAANIRAWFDESVQAAEQQRPGLLPSAKHLKNAVARALRETGLYDRHEAIEAVPASVELVRREGVVYQDAKGRLRLATSELRRALSESDTHALGAPDTDALSPGSRPVSEQALPTRADHGSPLDAFPAEATDTEDLDAQEATQVRKLQFLHEIAAIRQRANERGPASAAEVEYQEACLRVRQGDAPVSRMAIAQRFVADGRAGGKTAEALRQAMGRAEGWARAQILALRRSG